MAFGGCCSCCAFVSISVLGGHFALMLVVHHLGRWGCQGSGVESCLDLLLLACVDLLLIVICTIAFVIIMSLCTNQTHQMALEVLGHEPKAVQLWKFVLVMAPTTTEWLHHQTSTKHQHMFRMSILCV